MNSLQLQVKEGYDDDPIGRARIDHDCMDSLNMQDDDVVEITGERRTVARCWASHPAKDEGKGIIRIDRIIRINAGTEIGSAAVAEYLDFQYYILRALAYIVYYCHNTHPYLGITFIVPARFYPFGNRVAAESR
jgi:hypothetical protein